MTVTFLHTADWQIGKPYGSVADPAKRSALQAERLRVIDRMRSLVEAHGAAFVVVAGDLFDSPTPAKSIVSAVCQRIGSLGVPVFVIPGNHDHGGPMGVWEQPFFRQESAVLAPNLRVLLDCTPVDATTAVLLPCPLLRRHEATDTTTWLRSVDAELATFGTKARIAIAHGSVQGFSSASDEDDDAGAANQIELDKLDEKAYDYIALGDWHGTKQVGAKAWYAGTPEPDRHSKGSDYSAGNVLVVTAARGQAPHVVPCQCGAIGWHELSRELSDEQSLALLKHDIEELIGNRVDKDVLYLKLRGSLGMVQMKQLRALLEILESRLIRLKLDDRVSIAPTDDEIHALSSRAGDPLISRIASVLVEELEIDGQAEMARAALLELHLAVAGDA